MESRFARVGRASVRIWHPAPPPRRSLDAFPPAEAGPGAAPLDWRRTTRPLLCLAAFALALWPHWRWAAARLADGSDDPLGLAALAMLFAAGVRFAPRLRTEPAPGWLAVAVLLTSLATVLGLLAPALLAALLAALAFAAALAAFAPVGTPVLPLAGLAALALPVVSSLQFYAGFPLRVVTAEASRWLLALGGFDASREGSAMLVDGRLVIVDAPCSGVQMVWMAWFCACAVACWRGLPDRVFAKRLPFIGVAVLAGNVVRNTVLVGLEAGAVAVPAWQHEAIGMVVLGLVCGAVAWLVASARLPAPRQAIVFGPRSVALQGPLLAALAALLVVCALTPLAWSRTVAQAAPPVPMPTESPREWNGRPLRPLALGVVEARFAAQFPGRIERLTDERSVLVWREVRTPTRMLHPATDCYRGLGYRVVDARLERDAEARLWRCFVAERDGRRVRVCERIEDARGESFTDASSWFWAAQLGRSKGPWHAITVATPLGSLT
ncbi:MAG: exosortase Q [Burkholderiales bacterium]|nr:exosortase Q [Burkholderiales bacterium]